MGNKPPKRLGKSVKLSGQKDAYQLADMSEIPKEKKEKMTAPKPKKQKAKAKPQGEMDWVLDLIVNFMKSPWWRTPINDYIETHCVEFQEGVEQNQLHWSDYHKEFRDLVQTLIGTVLEEINITEQQFLEACSRGAMMPVHKKIFDDLISVEDFQQFKQLMIRRKKKLDKEIQLVLQQQAYSNFSQENPNPSQMIAQPPSMPQQQQSAEYDMDLLSEEEQLKLAQSMSIQFEEQQLKWLKKEEQELQRAIQLSQQPLGQGESNKEQVPPPPLIPIQDEKQEDDYQSNPLYPSIPQLPQELKQHHAGEQQVEELPRKEKKSTVKKVLPPVELHKSEMKDLQQRKEVSDSMKERAKEILKIQSHAPLIDLDDGVEDDEKEDLEASADPVKMAPYSSKKPTPQEIEERKKYLEATRNLIMQKRMEERKKELIEFEEKQPDKDDFYEKLMEIERQRKQKVQTNLVKSSPQAPEDEQQDDEERKAQIEKKKLQILKDAQMNLVLDIQKEKIEEERQAVQQKIKEVEQNIAVKKQKLQHA